MNIMYLIQTIEKTVLEQSVGNSRSLAFQGIILLKKQSKLLEQYLYVGQYPDGLSVLEQAEIPGSVTMFLSARDVNQVSLPPCGRHNVVVSALDIFDLYNRLNIVIQNYLHWAGALREALCSGQSLTQLLNTASAMVSSPIYILNPGCRLIAGSSGRYFHDPISEELLRQGSLSLESVQKLQDRGANAVLWEGCRQIFVDGIRYHIREIQKNSSHLATILLAENPEKQGIDFSQLLLDFTDIISHTLLENLEMLLNQDQRFSAFLKDILNERLTEDAQIQMRLGALTHPVHAFTCFVLIRRDASADQAAPPGVLMQHLQHVFPDTNMTVFQDDIVILHSQKTRPQTAMDFDYEELNRLMEQFHARAGVSNASRHRCRLRTLYTLASAAIRLGSALYRFSTEERIFSYEDYSMYYIIDLCARQFIEDHHHNDLIYLAHPSIIKICRYDAEHNTNLRDVLFYYLLNGCSLNRTARSMYMHRNTVLNKINKISELTEIPLEDGYTRHRMIMSCLIIRYYEDYLHMKTRL